MATQGSAKVLARPAQQLFHRPGRQSHDLGDLGVLPGRAGVRNPALANLPEPQWQEWQAFWQEVEGLLRGPVPA